MSWENVTDCCCRNWRLNRLGLWILCRQYVYNSLIFRRTRRVVHRPRWYEIFTPEIVEIRTDFAGINQARDQESYPLYSRLENAIAQSGESARALLEQTRQETEHYVREVQRMQGLASHANAESIDREVRFAQAGVDVATFVRNTSATILVVGSGIMSGGAGFTALSAGSILRGAGNYQDHGNVGSAIMDGAGTLVVGLIPFAGASVRGTASVTTAVGGEAIHYGQRAALVLVGATINAQVEAGKAVMEGSSGRDALRAAGGRFVVDLVSGAIGTTLDRRALPAIARIVTDSVTAMAGDAMVPSASPGSAPARRHASAGALPRATAPVCDVNTVLSTGDCSASDWVRQIVLQPA